MSASIKDLFAGTHGTDPAVVFDYDDSMYAAGGDTFAGADHDVLIGGDGAATPGGDEGCGMPADDRDVIAFGGDELDLDVEVALDDFDQDDFLGAAADDLFLGD